MKCGAAKQIDRDCSMYRCADSSDDFGARPDVDASSSAGCSSAPCRYHRTSAPSGVSLITVYVLLLAALSPGASVASVEYPMAQAGRTRLDVSVRPKRTVLYPGDSVTIQCVVRSWTRSTKRSTIDVGFFLEIAPDISLPVTTDLPGIDVWTGKENNESWSEDDDDVQQNTSRNQFPASSSRPPVEVRYLSIGKNAYKFLDYGENNFFCTGYERQSRTFRLDYFTVYKV